MNLTNHASIRSQQRGVPPLVIEWVQKLVKSPLITVEQSRDIWTRQQKKL